MAWSARAWRHAAAALVACSAGAARGSGAAPDAVGEVVVTGYVSDRSNAGLFGDLPVQDTPFSIAAYTAALLQQQQARTVREAVGNDPSVRFPTSEGAVGEQFSIRGFLLGNRDLATDGLFGLTNSRRTPIEFYERVEVFKGPNGLLNGTPPTGNVGGVINLVTKQATPRPVTQITGSFASDRYFGGHADVGRRFGDADQFGLRVNAVYRDGRLPFGFETNRLLGLSAAADFRSGPLRIFGFASHTDDRVTAPNTTYTFSDIVLPAPDGAINPSQPWVFFRSRYTGGYAGAALDLADGWTAQARYGHARTFDRSFATINATAVRPNGDFSFLPNIFSGKTNVDAYDATLIGRFRTGAVSHRLSLSTSAYSAELFGVRVTPPGAVLLRTNIYRPIFYPEPMLSRAGDYRRTGGSRLTSYAIADTLGLFGDRLLLTTGARHQRVRITSRGVTAHAAGRSDRARLSPTAALLLKASGAVSLYGSYTTALTPGPIPLPANCNFGATFPPVRSRQYEVGAKAAIGRFAAQLAAFEIMNPFSIQGPIQLRQPPCQPLLVDGRVRNRGLETTVSGRPVPSLQLVGGLSLYRGRLLRTQGGLADGNKAPGIPDVQLNLFADWAPAFLRGAALNARLTHTSGVAADTANSQRAPGWTVVDLGLSYRLTTGGTPMTLRAAVLNVADHDYYNAVSNGAFLRGAPRTARLSLTVDM